LEHTQALQGWQIRRNSTTALRAPRTWLISLGLFVIALVLLEVTLALLPAVSPALFASLSPNRLVLIGVVPPLFFFFALLLAIATNRSHKITAYRKAVKQHLAPSMSNYYAPEGALGVQEHLAALMSGRGLQEGQERHLLLLGGPGSGKTANLQYAVYRALSAAQQRTDKIPMLIQMKYYNGFLRNLRAASPEPGDSGEATATDTGVQAPAAAGAIPADTLLAYLLDNEHEQNLQAGKEPELVGVKHLRHYLPQFVAQGRIVFLCDGMNELENDALTIVHGELTRLMQTTQNSVVMTCRELEYQEQELLKSLASNGAGIKTLPPLTEADVAEIVKMHLQDQYTPGQIPLGETGVEEAQEQISRLSQSYRETSPFMLIMLIEALKTPDAHARAISRGRLLRLSVDQRPLVHEPDALIFGDHPDAQYVRDFLSAVACTARRDGQRNAIQLVKDAKFTTSSQLQDFLNVWLSDHEVDVGNFTQANIGKYLRIALNAGLITISNNGVLSFIHELIAEYFAAEYLRFMYHRKDSEDEPFWHSIYESEVLAAGLWSEPIAIWAGLEEQPKEIARFLMTSIDHYCRQKGLDEAEADFYHYHALALSLGCLGVRASDGLPEETLSYLKQSVLVKEKHEQLSLIFKRCADEGGIGVYQALLPYIHLPGLLDVLLKIHELYREKDRSTILAMLFEYLENAAVRPAYVEQTQALITLLGEVGRRGNETVRPRTHHLSEPSMPPLLRAAAMNILELLRNPDDVLMLISYLHTSDIVVMGSAISAVRAFGPDFTLALLEREEAKLQDQAYAQTRLNILRVLEGFLEAPTPPFDIPRYMQTLVALLIRFFSSFDQEPTWLLARQLLQEQIQKSPEDASLVAICLLDAIDTQDQTQAEQIQALLRENCLRVLGSITGYWNTRKRRELAWERIITVLGNTSDAAILVFLLQQLEESAPNVRRALSAALSAQEESTAPLLQAVLTPIATQNVIQVAGDALRQIGVDCIAAICETFVNIRSHAEATDAGLKCLLDVLNELRKNGRIIARAEGGIVRALVALFKWLDDNAQVHAPLIAEVIPVMAGYRDQRVVATLLKALAQPGVLLERVYEEAMKGLKQLGDFAVDYLLESLNSPKETLQVKRVRQVLLEMTPFPRMRLVAALADSRSAIVGQVMWIFIANQQDVETTRFLVKSMLEGTHDHPLFDNIQRTLAEMQPEWTMPCLIEVLGQPHWQVIKPLLRTCPRPDIILPLLFRDLADLQRYALVLEILREEFDYPTALPWLVSGLVNEQTRQDTRRLIATMARTYDGNLLPDIVRLFNPAIAQPEPLPGPLPEVRRTLQELLTTELADTSLPAVVGGLAEPPLREGCIDSLVILAHIQERQQEVLQAVLQALRNPSQRLGAHQTLVRFSPLAAQSVSELVRERDQDLAKEARAILAEMGEVAFPYIYQLAHDLEHRGRAEDILRLIPVETTSKGLLMCFASNDRAQEETAFYLLTMGLDAEQRAGSSRLMSALLAQTLEYAHNDAYWRTLSALLFFSNRRRLEMAQQMVNAITRTAGARIPSEYLRAMVLLGRDAADPLGVAIHTPGVPESVRLEMVGLLGTLAEDEENTSYVNVLAAGNNGTVNEHRAWGLRALGGLLAGGIYNEKKLEEIRQSLSVSSKAQDRNAFEFFDVLLGKRNWQEISRLREVINKQQDDIDRLNKRILQQEEELARARHRAERGEARALTLPKFTRR
jgi:hypothetical protein